VANSNLNILLEHRVDSELAFRSPASDTAPGRAGPAARRRRLAIWPEKVPSPPHRMAAATARYGLGAAARAGLAAGAGCRGKPGPHAGPQARFKTTCSGGGGRGRTEDQ
jgi:hypothetical protein